jgi:hypothetical protein
MRTLRLFAMGRDEGCISPYLLRPLRTLEEVLGGRDRTVETTRGGIEVMPTCCDQRVRSRTAVENHRSAPLGAAD